MSESMEISGLQRSLEKNASEIKPKELGSLLSDAGVYSYAAICALALHEMFDDEWNSDFSEHCIKSLIKYLQLPKQVEGVMLTLTHGPNHHTYTAYVDLLRSEDALQDGALLVVEDLITFAVKEGRYDARLRVLALRVSEMLGVPPAMMEACEGAAITQLTQQVREPTPEEVAHQTSQRRSKKAQRIALIGLAGLGGGAVLGLTGGLAAPLIGAGLAGLLGGAGAALGTSAGAAVIGSVCGLAGAGLTGFKMKKRVGEIEEFAFAPLPPWSDGPAVSGEQLHVAVAVSGWLSDEEADNFSRPWSSLAASKEQYTLRWESPYLLELGHAMEAVLSLAVSMAAQEALKYTVLSGLITAVAWPSSLITLASVIDNPWGVCCRRSAQVGQQLAEVLLSREQGSRPVSLVGFSLGARVIYCCLKEMASRKGCEGVVQDAVLVGAPVSGSAAQWKSLTRVVAGRLVNGYCRSDWLLRFLYRTLSVSPAVAGLQPVELDDRRMVNVDLSDVVAGHSDYPEKMELVLRKLGIRTWEHPPDWDSQLKKSTSDLPPTSLPAKVSLLSLRQSRSDNCLLLADVNPGGPVGLSRSGESTSDSSTPRMGSEGSLQSEETLGGSDNSLQDGLESAGTTGIARQDP